MEKVDKINRAQELFVQAWNEASNDWEKCIAAHFVARHQQSPKDTLKWNAESLDRANKVRNNEVKGYYSSLYLNMGTSCEKLGKYAEAKNYYDLAFENISALPRDVENEKYSKGVEETIVEQRSMLEEKMKYNSLHKTPNDLDVVLKEGERETVSTGFVRRPKILEDAGFDIYLDESKLKNLPVPVTKMELKEFEWMLDLPVWEKDSTDDWNLTPREVIENKPDTGIHPIELKKAPRSKS